MKMKRNAFTLVLLMLALITGCKKEEEGGLEKTPEAPPEEEKHVEKIPYSEIPDLFFRDYLLTYFDTDMDGFISKEEAEAVKEIDLTNNGKKIESLKGIEYFTSLETLYIKGVGISEFDLSANKMLVYLDCSQNPLKTIILPSSSPLKYLNCSNCELETFNASGLEALEYFDCSDNKPLTTLLFSENRSLNYLKCDNTAIETLDLRKLEQLEVLICGKITAISTQNLPLLSTLHLPESKRLKSLYCWNTDIKTIELNGFQSLEVFEFYAIYQYTSNYRNFERLDITNSSVKRVLFYGYNLQSVNINNLPDLEFMAIRNSSYRQNDNQPIDLTQSVHLKTLTFERLNCDLNINSCTALETLNIQGSVHVSSFTNNTALKEMVFIAPIDDEILDFSAHTLLEKLHIQNNSIKTVLLQQSNSLKNISLYCNNLSSVNLSGCVNLDSIWIYSSSTAELEIDISNCSNLRIINHFLANLSKLNASGCKKLESFNHRNNGIYYFGTMRTLTDLNMSNCTSLQTLTCSDNKLTSLDVSGCTALNRLECNNNNLASLDVSSCSALNILNCSGNMDLYTLMLNTNHHITTLSKDEHTQIVLKD